MSSFDDESDGVSPARRSSPKKSINRYLDEDTLAKIFEYLTPLDLNSSSECDRLWLSISKFDRQLWEHHSIKLWDMKSVNVPDLTNISILERIKKVPLIKIKRALQRVDISRCIEKIDFQRMFLTYLLFKDRSAENSTALRIYYPEWALKINIYKATYWHALKERFRTDILFGELCAIDWKFHFKHENDAQQEMLYDPNRYSKFREDYTLKSSIQENVFNWQFVTTSHHGHNTTQIQVEHYPAMTCTRLSDGSWRMDNPYVWFEQVNPLPSDTLPLI